MIWRNTIERYGAVHKFLHWTIALAVLFMLVLGLVMEDIPHGLAVALGYGDVSPLVLRMKAFSLHKAIGITVLALMLLRIVWKLVNWDLPKSLPTHERWEQKLAHLVHWGFYGLLIAMPLSGWIMTSAKASTINWFGFFPVPPIVQPNQELGYSMARAHEYIAYGIWAFIALHVAGALKHVVIDKDGTLRRMLPFTAAAFLLLSPIALHAADKAPVWVIDRTQSHLNFEATQEGSSFKGQFKAFSGSLTFDPKNPGSGKGNILIDLGSIDSANAERDTAVKEKDWFDIATNPTATFTIDKFEKGKEDDAYLALGYLKLRGLERPLDLPFKLTVTEKDGIKTAHAVGETSLKRLDFGVGGGQWADPAMVGDSITIRIDVIATAKTQ